ncbi:uncharacterized protein [Centruroides vittatus]|uniref:uncharacterized protein n=1 Tax=Centruroides vittatus TaxID=120091 RepID=UPI00351030AD
MVLVAASSRAKLENKANKTLENIRQWGKANKLDFNPKKTKGIIFTRPRTPHLYRRVLTVKMDNTSVKIEQTLKYLGITLHHRLSWIPHVKNVSDKTNQLYNEMTKIAKSNWGLCPQIMSTIYDSVFIPMLSYAVPAWAESIDQTHIYRKLQSAQRKALLRICRAYSTTPTAALQVIAGKLPINQELGIIVNRWKLRKGHDINVNGDIIDNIEAYHPHNARPAPYNWPQIVNIPWPDQALSVYTDGSKNEEEVGSAFVAYHNNKEVHNFTNKLGKHCTAYQAELWAILSAIRWCNENYKSTAIGNYDWRHPICNQILHELNTITNFYALVWVRGHSGIEGNEWADSLAHSASATGNVVGYTSTPHSYIIRKLRDNALSIWQHKWNMRYNTITKKFFPAVSIAIKHDIGHHLSQFYTNHGNFNNYLNRFGKSTNKNCVICGIPDRAEHYLLQCPMLQDVRQNIISLLPPGTNWPCQLDMLLQEKNLKKTFEEMVKKYFQRTTVR